MISDDDMKSVRLAYGWLWHSFANDPRVNRARRALADVLDHDGRVAGIEEAKADGAEVDVSDVLALSLPARATEGK